METGWMDGWIASSRGAVVGPATLGRDQKSNTVYLRTGAPLRYDEPVKPVCRSDPIRSYRPIHTYETGTLLLVSGPSPTGPMLVEKDIRNSGERLRLCLFMNSLGTVKVYGYSSADQAQQAMERCSQEFVLYRSSSSSSSSFSGP